MARGIIVVDMPENCLSCGSRLCFDGSYYCGAKARFLDDWEFDLSKERAGWCPIKPMPEKANHKDYCDNGRYDKGWNECIDAIEHS